MDEEQEKVQHSIADTPPGYKSWLRGQVTDLLPVSETSAHNLAEDPGDGSVARCTCGWVPSFRVGIDKWGYLEGVNSHIAHARALEHARRDIEAHQAAERAAQVAREKDEIRAGYAKAVKDGNPFAALAFTWTNPWLKEEVWGPPAPIVPLEHQPRRGDAIEAWLTSERELYTHNDGISYKTVDYLLEHYQQLADEGTPMRAVAQEA